MGLEKYRTKNGHEPWALGKSFICPKCKSTCSGQNTSLFNQRTRIIRWCSECNYYEASVRDPIEYVSISVLSRK